MKITDLRIGNIVDYETIYYRVDSLIGENKVILTAINHEWEPEPAGIAEIVGIPLTPEILKTLGFEPLNKKTTHLWIKNVGGYRYIRYMTRFIIWSLNICRASHACLGPSRRFTRCKTPVLTTDWMSRESFLISNKL